ncbi:class I SAM-dependent methyltransferase [bacterium]|nr:class I SAM-dependent methyltransferase [bacterium]
MKQAFSYTGRDNLDAMSYALNYNNYIYSWLSKNLKRDDSVLDFGSGHGEFFNRFQDDNFSAVAIEPDLSMHQFYKNKTIYQSIDKVKRRFDLIYSVNVLEHVQDDEAIVKIFKDYLVDEESIVKIFVPARQELFSAMDRKVGHYRRYSKSQLEKLFIDNGYKVKTCRYFDSLGYFAAFIYKFVNKSGDINKHGVKIFDKYIFPMNFIADKIFCRFFGKNIMLEASRK